MIDIYLFIYVQFEVSLFLFSTKHLVFNMCSVYLNVILIFYFNFQTVFTVKT